MEISTRDADEVAVVLFSGKLETATVPAAQDQLNRLVAQGITKIVVNFEKLEFITSSGLRVLLLTAKQLKAGGGEMRICSLNETVHEIFKISGFSSIFRPFDTESQALEGF